MGRRRPEIPSENGKEQLWLKIRCSLPREPWFRNVSRAVLAGTGVGSDTDILILIFLFRNSVVFTIVKYKCENRDTLFQHG